MSLTYCAARTVMHCLSAAGLFVTDQSRAAFRKTRLMPADYPKGRHIRAVMQNRLQMIGRTQTLPCRESECDHSKSPSFRLKQYSFGRVSTTRICEAAVAEFPLQANQLRQLDAEG